MTTLIFPLIQNGVSLFIFLSINVSVSRFLNTSGPTLSVNDGRVVNSTRNTNAAYSFSSVIHVLPNALNPDMLSCLDRAVRLLFSLPPYNIRASFPYLKFYDK